MKYHKTHILYKALPEHLNPENFRPDTSAIVGLDAIRERYAAATAGSTADHSQDAEHIPVVATVVGFQRLPAAGQPRRITGAPVVSAPGYVPGAAVVATPAAAPILVAPVACATTERQLEPVWEFETRKGFEAFNMDCQAIVEQRFQEFVGGAGGPKRHIKTCGHEVEIDFEHMTQTTGDRVRKIQRNEGRSGAPLDTE